MTCFARAERAENERTKKRQPSQEPSEVVANGGEDGVDGIAGGVRQMIAAHAVISFQVSDHRLDRRAPPHEPFYRVRHAALLSCGVDADVVRRGCIVSTIVGVGVNRRAILTPIWGESASNFDPSPGW